MKRTATVLLLALAACGETDAEEACAYPEQRILFDGELVADPACTNLSLRVSMRESGTRGSLVAGYFTAMRPEFQIDFEMGEPPTTFDVGHDQLQAPTDPPWAYAIYSWEDETGPLRATSGTGSLEVEDGHAVVDITGQIARRDGQERPFSARFEGMLEVECDPPCDLAADVCDAAQTAICDRFRALSSWRRPVAK